MAESALCSFSVVVVGVPPLPAPEIFQNGDLFEVRRFHAQLDPTEVVANQLIGKLLPVEKERESVSFESDSTVSKQGVLAVSPSIHVAIPNPTPFFLCDLGPKHVLVDWTNGEDLAFVRDLERTVLTRRLHLAQPPSTWPLLIRHCRP